MTLRLGLRALAVIIALAGVADPAWTRNQSVQPLVTVVSAGTVSPNATSRIRAALENDYRIDWRTHAAGSGAACPSGRSCLLVTDGTVPRQLTDGAAIIGAVLDVDKNIERPFITRVESTGPVHLNGGARLRVHVRAADASGSYGLRVLDEDVIVGEGIYQWPKRATDEVADVVEVDWVPVATGPRRLRVAISDAGFVDHGVLVEDAPTRVMIHEPEVTWLGTFVRRALETDSRLILEGHARVAPPVVISRGASPARLSATTLETSRVVIVGGANLVTSADVDLLERFVRVRGGSVVILLDRTPTGAILRLLPAVVAERRDAVPRALGPLKVSEWLVFDAGKAGATALESVDDKSASIVARSLGRGRVIASGALDAWRYRDSDGAFAGYWSGLVLDAAAASRPTFEVSATDTLLQRGDATQVNAEWRTMQDLPSETLVEATVECNGQREFLRMWPGARAGTYAGTFLGDRSGVCRIVVSNGIVSSATPVRVVDDLSRPPPELDQLHGVMAAHGAIVVTSKDETALMERVRSVVPAAREPRETRPMQSPWWIVPFAACLAGEWSLRRRIGLR
jgi:hypothetical protein